RPGRLGGAAQSERRARAWGSPPSRIGLRATGAGHPAAAAAGAPGLAAPRRLGLIGAGDGKELPLLLAGLAVDAEDRAAPRPFAALTADDDRVLHGERRAREADGEFLGIDKPRVPHRLAGLHVERDEAPVDGAHIDIA